MATRSAIVSDGDESIRPGVRCRIGSESGALVTEKESPASAKVRQLAHDALVVCAEVRWSDEGRRRARIASPAGWVDANDLEAVGSAPSLSLDRPTFLARHLEVGAGDHYGLVFPISLEALREAGPGFLTEAFRAAGTLASDDRVTEIVKLEPLGHNGASDAAFLSVAYATGDPSLHTELFVKVPPVDVDRKFTVAAMAHGEVAINRRAAEGMLPVPVAKYYFGDYCTRTANFILITERIAFGQDPIEPAWAKGYEHHVPDVQAHYRVLSQALARVVAAHKRGALGDDIERDFPFGRSARSFAPIDAVEQKIDWLIDFVSRVAPQLFSPGTTSPAFLARWREDVLFGVAHHKEVIAYLHANVDYTGLCHPNLNVDNAWYWRDDTGALHAGWLDLGGFGQMSIAQALNSMPMMSEPDRYVAIEREIITSFVETCEAEGGPSLDLGELQLQYRAAVLSVSLGLILGSAAGFLSSFSDEEYASMADVSDPRLRDTGLAAGIVWIDNVLRRWLDDLTPGEAWRRIVS